MTNRIELLRQRLENAFKPLQLDIVDESRQHAGHPGTGGGGHFNVTVVSTQFIDKPLIDRHRMVYEAVDGLMHSDIHALKINARSPDE